MKKGVDNRVCHASTHYEPLSKVKRPNRSQTNGFINTILLKLRMLQNEFIRQISLIESASEENVRPEEKDTDPTKDYYSCTHYCQLLRVVKLGRQLELILVLFHKLVPKGNFILIAV